MNAYRRQVAELRAKIEKLPELHDTLLQQFPEIWEHLIILTPPPCELEILCEYVSALDDWVTWVDEWFEDNVPDGDKVTKPPKPTWPPEE